MMKYTVIPQTDLRVSALCLGSAEFGGRINEADARALLDAYVAAGGTFIDTASVYCDWIPGEKSRSEKIIGRWLKDKGLRDQLVIATKGAHPELATMHISRLSHDEIVADLDASLANLQTHRIDLYWLHRDDAAVPVGEIIDTLNEQVQAGKIRYFGASNWKVERIQAAHDYAVARGINSFVANQPMWSLADPNREAIPDKTIEVMDGETLTFHRRTEMTVMAYSSQAHGFFSKLDSGATIADGDMRVYDNALNRRRLVYAQALARQYDASVNAIVLAYLVSQPFTTIPIIGPRLADQLDASLKALEIRLTAEEVNELENE